MPLRLRLFALAVLAVCLCLVCAPARGEPLRYLKGQTHLHSSNSPDSSTSPAEVARFYAAHGYDFIVFTDHDHVTDLTLQHSPMLVIPGAELTQNFLRCTPRPEVSRACMLHVNALFLDPGGPSQILWPARRSV